MARGSVRPCASRRYSYPRGLDHAGFSLLTTSGATSPFSTDHQYRDDRFSCSIPAPVTNSRHLYTGHRQGHTQVAPWLKTHKSASLSWGLEAPPVSMPSRFFSMRQQWFTHVRLFVTQLTRC